MRGEWFVRSTRPAGQEALEFFQGLACEVCKGQSGMTFSPYTGFHLVKASFEQKLHLSETCCP